MLLGQADIPIVNNAAALTAKPMAL